MDIYQQSVLADKLQNYHKKITVFDNLRILPISGVTSASGRPTVVFPS
jgi:hypothetical protein